MIYLSPYYPTNYLHQDVQFVKQWRSQKFCLLSGDGIQEVDALAKALHLRREGRVQEDDTEGLPEFVVNRAGKASVYWIIHPTYARKALIAGAVITDEKGEWSNSTIPKTLAQRHQGQLEKRCEYVDDRGVQCQSPPMTKSKYCRPHINNKTAMSRPNINRTNNGGRYTNHLPQRLAQLFEEARQRPDLLEMEEQIAVLDAKLKTMMEEVDENMPSPKALRDLVLQCYDPDLRNEALAGLEEMALKGIQQEYIWTRIHGTMEQQRKMVSTEIQRRKDLNLMIPVERVMALMAAVSDTIKRYVNDREILGQIQREIRQLMTTTGGRVAPEPPIDVTQV